MAVKFHFLNVGSGDCTIIYFPARINRADNRSISERVMMVDINHHAGDDYYQDVISYYKTIFKDTNGQVLPIFRFVCSHPHQDHISGLNEFLSDPEIRIINFWDLNHEFVPETFDYSETHEADWDAYKELRQKPGVTYLQLTRETGPGKFWCDDEDRVSILSPSIELRRFAHHKEDGMKREAHEIEIDEMSYALLIRINTRKVLLAGDGRKTPFWEDIYTNCSNDIQNIDVLKAGHHGQECAFHEDAVKLMKPSHVIFSNSKTEDEECGGEMLYKQTVPSAKILKTCIHQNIVVSVPFEASDPITYESNLTRQARSIVNRLIYK